MSTPNNRITRSKALPALPSSLQFFSVAEVAIILGTSSRSVHEWIQSGLLPSFRLGQKNRIIRIRQPDLEKFINAHIRSGSLKLNAEETDETNVVD